MCEIYLIFLTGFALLGLYCFIDTVISIVAMSKYTPTVTIFYNTQKAEVFAKLRYVENNVPNNYNIYYPFDETKSDAEQGKLIVEYLNNVFGVNKKWHLCFLYRLGVIFVVQYTYKI